MLTDSTVFFRKALATQAEQIEYLVLWTVVVLPFLYSFLILDYWIAVTIVLKNNPCR